MPAEGQFLNKLEELPIVHDGWSTAVDYYTKVKAYNSLTKFTLGAAETSLKKAAEISTPVLARYQPQIDTVNNYACSKLETIEGKFPILKQPTEEVKGACVGYVQPAFDTVKPVVSYVNGVVENTQGKVNKIKETSNNVVNGARDMGYKTVNQAVTLGYSTVNQVVTRSLDTPPGRVVISTLDHALTQADTLIDKYFPEEKQGGEESGDEDEIQVPVDEAPASQARVVKQLRRVCSKLQRRLPKRAKSNFDVAKTRTMEALTHLQSTLDLRDYAKTNLTGAYSMAQNIWQKINEKEGSTVEKTDDDAEVKVKTNAEKLEERIITMSRIITGQFSTAVAALEKASAEAGLFVKDPISKSREYKDLVYQFSSSNLSFGYEKVKEIIASLQGRLKTMTSKIELPQWPRKEEENIEMEQITESEENKPDSSS